MKRPRQRSRWHDLLPNLVFGAGFLISTTVATQTDEYGWWVLLGPLCLALTFLGAATLDAGLRGASLRPTRDIVILGAACLVSSLIVAMRDPSLVATLIPVVGPALWVVAFLSSARRREACSLP